MNIACILVAYIKKVVLWSIKQKLFHTLLFPIPQGQPSFIRVYKYPNFAGQGSAIANRSFYKAEDVKMLWNNAGTALLVLTTTEISDQSYYGEQGLHYINVNGEGCLVPRCKLYHFLMPETQCWNLIRSAKWFYKKKQNHILKSTCRHKTCSTNEYIYTSSTKIQELKSI